MLEKAFETLSTYDFGPALNQLKPIDEAVLATHGDTGERKKLEEKLVGALKSDTPRGAKDFICRKLMVIGTSASVPALASLLPQKEDSHMARYALERIDAPDAAKALRDALPNVSSELQVGVISSLGVRQDQESVGALGEVAGAAEATVARAAAFALGAIRSAAAAQALAKAKPTTESKSAVTDASLACAEGLLADGDNAAALKIYKGLAGEDQPKHVRLAATRGMLACAGKKS